MDLIDSYISFIIYSVYAADLLPHLLRQNNSPMIYNKTKQALR